MKKPVIAALCCLLALGTATAAFAEELVCLRDPSVVQPFVPASVFGNDCCRAAAQVAFYRILERHHPGIPNEDDSCRH